MKRKELAAFLSLLLLLMACTRSMELPRDEQLASIVTLTLTARPGFIPFSGFTVSPIAIKTYILDHILWMHHISGFPGKVRMGVEKLRRGWIVFDWIGSQHGFSRL